MTRRPRIGDRAVDALNAAALGAVALRAVDGLQLRALGAGRIASVDMHTAYLGLREWGGFPRTMDVYRLSPKG